MRRLFAISLAVVMLVGCGPIPTLPELGARNKWNGRTAAQAIDFFGPPNGMEPAGEGKAVMYWLRDTSYKVTQMVGNTSEVHGGVRVNTNYYQDSIRDRECLVAFTVNKEKKVINVEFHGRNCAAVDLGP